MGKATQATDDLRRTIPIHSLRTKAGLLKQPLNTHINGVQKPLGSTGFVEVEQTKHHAGGAIEHIGGSSGREECAGSWLDDLQGAVNKTMLSGNASDLRHRVRRSHASTEEGIGVGRAM